MKAPCPHTTWARVRGVAHRTSATLGSRVASAAQVLGLLALVSVPMLSGCGHQENSVPDAVPVAVRATTVASHQAAGTVEATGSLHGTREVVLTAKVMGTVIETPKRAGDPVRKGEILLRLDDREVSGQIGQAQGALVQAQAAVALAAANFKRFEQLFTRGAASQLELDQARYQYDTARGAVNQAESAVATASSYRSYANIPAPFDGRVVERMCELGDLATPGRPLLKIEDARRVRVHVTLGESQASAAVAGAVVQVVVPALGDRTFTGIVAEVMPAVDPATRSLLVKIDLPQDPELRSGLFGRARFPAGPHSALQVPRAALVYRGGLTGVFVLQEGRAAFRLVEVSESSADLVEVLSGLSAGDRVVLDPPATLIEGTPVEAGE